MSLLRLRDARLEARQAILKGATVVNPCNVAWDLSATCQKPVRVERKGRGASPKGGHTAMYLDIDVRCRKCEACRRHRARLWAARARDEIGLSSRTWFGTLTLNPNAHHVALFSAVHKSGARALDFHTLTPSEQFRRRVDAITPEITKWLKRVRKNSGAPLRYLLVAEPHKSGLPHFHILVHESDRDRPVRHSTLTDAWQLGFSKFKLVETDKRVAGYVAKYLAKENDARVRASFSYGRRSNNIGFPQEHRVPPTLSLLPVPGVGQQLKERDCAKRLSSNLGEAEHSAPNAETFAAADTGK